MNQRETTVSLGGLGAALLSASANLIGAEAEPNQRRSRMGIVIYALGAHQKYRWAGRHTGLSPALALLEESNLFGAAGIQVELGQADAPNISELRRRAEGHGMYIEASIQTPRDA